jgi:hypothetical protein
VERYYYRAKDVRWIPSYKHLAPMALWSMTTPTPNAHAICGSESVALSMVAQRRIVLSPGAP